MTPLFRLSALVAMALMVVVVVIAMAVPATYFLVVGWVVSGVELSRVYQMVARRELP